MCFDFLYKLFRILRIERDTVKNALRYSCEVPVMFVGF